MDEPRGSTNTSSTENTKVANSIIHKTKVFGSVKLGRAAETCKFLEVSEVTTPASMTQAPVLPEQEFSARNETHAWLACTFSRVGKKKDGENIEPCEKCDPVNTGEARLSIKVAGEKMEDVLKHVTAVDTIVGELHSRIYRIPVSPTEEKLLQMLQIKLNQARLNAKVFNEVAEELYASLAKTAGRE